MIKPSQIIIATRASQLALWQAQHVKKLLQQQHPELTVTLLTKTTTGDKEQHIALAAIGGKNLFVKELQSAILEQEADIAVHSIKDLSCTPHPKLTLAAICERADARDVFVSQRFRHFAELPPHAIIGTASPRRECQVKALRPDVACKLLRGNVNTRLKKLALGEYDAIILAAAGLTRLGFTEHICEYFPTNRLLPAIGQGAIGIECRQDDKFLQKLLAPLNHHPSALCVTAERAVNFHLGGDCFTPIAAHAVLTQQQIELHALVGSLSTNTILTTQIQGPATSAHELGIQAAKNLLNQGAAKLLTTEK